MVDGAMSEPNKDEGIGNLFKIIDGIVYQLHRTKRMFIIMILTVMILPPVSLFVASVYLEPPFGGDGHGRPPPPGIGGREPQFSIVQQLPLFLSNVLVCGGVYPWHLLFKWDKKKAR